eukprot:4982549-Pyramimonas_sp.AAC.1
MSRMYRRWRQALCDAGRPPLAQVFLRWQWRWAKDTALSCFGRDGGDIEEASVVGGSQQVPSPMYAP